jgi:hypothetical protein
MKFKLTDTNIFVLPGNPHMIHIATIAYGFREFVAMLDSRTQKFYIEEVVLTTKDFAKDVWANFKFIDDDLLASELAAFCNEKKVQDMKRIQETILDQQSTRAVPGKIHI